MSGLGEGGLGEGPLGGSISTILIAEGPPPDVLSGAAGWAPTAASWLDGELLALDIPVVSGRLSVVGSARVPEEVVFTVPDVVDGFSWVPGEDPRHPLARFGQQIDLGIDVTSPLTGGVSHWRLGRFRVHDWAWDDLAGTVTVTCWGILTRAQEAKFTVPETPRAGGTFASEFRRLMVPGVPVFIDSGLADRPVPQSLQYPSDRLDTLYAIADAWPARILTDRWGTVNVLAPLPLVPSPLWLLSDGEGGVLVSAPRLDTRTGLYNVVVGTSSALDTTAMSPVRAVAQITTGPLKVTDDGTGYGPVVYEWSLPLAVTQAEMQASVDTMVVEKARPSVISTVHCAPDPRIGLSDPASVSRAGETWWGYVVAYELPLTVRDGDMRIDIGVTS